MEHQRSKSDFLPGQGILEVMLGLSLLFIGLFGTFALVLGGLKESKESTHRLQAVNLAREGLEVVRNIRDSNWLKMGVSWEAGLSDAGDGTAALVFKPDSNTFVLDFRANAITDAEANVVLSPTSFPFRRLLTIAPSSPSDGKQVTIVVEWDEGGKTNRIQLQDWLSNWK